MRKLYIMIIIMSISLLSAATLELYQDFSDGMALRLEGLRTSPFQADPLDEGEEFAPTPTILKTIAFPYQEADLQVKHMVWRVFDQNGVYLRTKSEVIDSAVALSSPFTFREMRGYSIKIESQISHQGEIYTLQDIDIELSGRGLIDLPQSVSPAFLPAYRELADNWDYSYLKSLPVHRPKMLIVSHPQLAVFQKDFIAWKRSLGYDVEVVHKAQMGNSAPQIRNYLRENYLENKPDYLLLMGDTVGSFAIPTNFYPSPEYNENDADDQFYAILEGDDYFPEMMVGRFSFTEPMQLIVMLTKTIEYEKGPYMASTSWLYRNLVVAGNYAEGTLRPTTPVWMSRWLRQKMLDYGYAQVDTVYFPGHNPGTDLIKQYVNAGVQFVSYRGWGDANGWHYPYFHTENLATTNNGGKLPIVFSIVCNTGDFANSVNPCFGEKWMQMGTAASPNGAVGFVGPSDLHTKTRLNNSISSGAFRSIFDLGVRSFATSVMMGKIELYKNFPLETAVDGYVPFYFHVYNLLSDPSLNMWVLEPSPIPESVIQSGSTLPLGASHIKIQGNGLIGAIVSGTFDKENFTYAKVGYDGVAILPIDPENDGALTITVSKENRIPLVKTLTRSGEAKLGITANTGENLRLNANQQAEISLTVKNLSEEALADVQIGFADHEKIQITPLDGNTFSLAAGADHTLRYQLSALNTVRPEEVLQLNVNFTNPAYQYSFNVLGGGAALSIIDHQGTLQLDDTSQITFFGINFGTSNLENATVVVQSRTSGAIASSQPISLGNISAADDFSISASIGLAHDVWAGMNIPLRFIFTDDTGYAYTANYALTAGNPSLNDPTGPCEYGYFAYDSSDVDYNEAPLYSWVEMDPLLGGSGNLWTIMDDGVKRVQLPFSFGFYGKNYEALTISSNGWISFEHTNDSYFNNHYIPAALGPDALIAPYWDDLKGMKTGINEAGEGVFNDMRILYGYVESLGAYVVQWNDAYNQYTIDAGENAALEKFQVLLFPKEGQDGDIIVQYHTIDNPNITGNYATVGLVDKGHLRGLNYSFNNIYPPTAAPLAAGLAIKFTTVAPAVHDSNEDLVNAPAISKLTNYPNPFNPTTTISFESRDFAIGSLSIYNMKGQLVRKLYNGAISKGENSFVWDGKDDTGSTLASGLYFYQIKTEGLTLGKKMLLMK